MKVLKLEEITVLLVSSYFAEVPDPISEKEQFKNFIKVWGKPIFSGNNPSQPKLVNPVNKEGVSNDENPY
ncbi:hypothetical protein A6A11_04250 [Bisgaardia hudsonensis]|uniref:hypothetical protein n=1 Tax=Bisgaardia hudsonensis TaxID=109472 RepID=UPI00104B2DB5|nr:hypothetical protein [Bisgaardia hudsonensis]QLB12873.1 hypothetical protein A6A11_04250 [Bisgaardia hudsonensis]